MRVYSASDQALLVDLGLRFRRHRLRQNITQEDLAEHTLLSVGTIKALELGRAKLSTMVAVMRELQLLHELEHFLKPPELSPLQLAAQNSPRQRARPGRKPEPREKR